MTNNNRLDPGFWVGIGMIALLILLSHGSCNAQTFRSRTVKRTTSTAVVDTIAIDAKNIVKFIERNEKVFAVYKDDKISDIIPVNKTTLDYIETCRQCGIVPILGIRFKDGVIQSIVKFKRKYVIR